LILLGLFKCKFIGDLGAIEMARACTRKLIKLQGPQGEWPWFFDAEQGRVLDFYEVYSVHQYGMAPAFLECAEHHDVQEARDALIKGFKWVLGDNQLQRPTLVSELQLSFVHTFGRANRSLRKIIKTRGSFPNDEAALKLLYLAIRNAGMRWRRAIEWTKAMGQFAIQFGDRFPPSAN
jgi:hypothetical protein